MQGAECCDKATESFSVSAALLRLLASFRSSFWFCRTFPPQYSGRLLTSIVISYESVIRVRKNKVSPANSPLSQAEDQATIAGLHLCFTKPGSRKFKPNLTKLLSLQTQLKPPKQAVDEDLLPIIAGFYSEFLAPSAEKGTSVILQH